MYYYCEKMAVKLIFAASVLIFESQLHPTGVLFRVSSCRIYSGLEAVYKLNEFQHNIMRQFYPEGLFLPENRMYLPLVSFCTFLFFNFTIHHKQCVYVVFFKECYDSLCIANSNKINKITISK